MKLGTNIQPSSDDVQRTRTDIPPSFFMELCPFEFFLWKSCPLYNFDTVQNIFIKLCTKYKPLSDDVHRKRTEAPPTSLRNCASLKFFPWKSCPLYNFNTIKNIFMKLCTNINRCQKMCKKRKRTITTPTFLRNYAPLKFFLWKSCPLCNFNTVKKIFMKLCTNIHQYQTMCKEKEPLLHLHFYGIMLLWFFFLWKLCPLLNFNTVGNIFMELSTNINHHQTMWREQEP